MSNGFQFIDIIFFAMIAVFLVLRLRGALGRRDNEENGFEDPFRRDASEDEQDGNVIQLPDRGETEVSDSMDQTFDTTTTMGEAAEAWPTTELAEGIRDVRAIDPSFDSEDFLVGARVAFEMVLNAYASGDTDTLKQLLSNDVFANFANVIQDREQAGHVMEDTLVGIQVADIMEAYTEGRIINVTVKFVTDQINITRDENGDVVEGSPNAVITVTDFWTFAHDSRSKDPNWTLIATRSLD
jgi:predicted lipid-binding transport protein (Tim44 family)